MNYLKSGILTLLFAFTFLSSKTTNAEVEHHHEEETKEFNAVEMIMHHIQDAHDFHIMDIDGHAVSVPLPVIIYDTEKGLSFFLSSKFEHGHASYNGYKLDHGKIIAESGSKIYDFSITKNAAAILMSVIVLLLVFTSIAKAYDKSRGKAPKGLQSFLEPIILFVRDEVAKPSIGKHKYLQFTPYLLTIFFFIWVNNLMGLIPFFPFGANVTGNIAVTMVLAVATFLMTNLNGNKDYWKHIFATPGVPKAMLLIMIPVEIIGLFTKPFALMIRLFANITAGHILILSLVSLIFMFKTYAMSPVSVGFMLFMNCLELLVALLQAYIFTLLSALFIGSAVAEHDHH
jgi:F-type H+-transporting ATPase subunit a